MFGCDSDKLGGPAKGPFSKCRLLWYPPFAQLLYIDPRGEVTTGADTELSTVVPVVRLRHGSMSGTLVENAVTILILVGDAPICAERVASRIT
jgi:hypothetical protein